MPKVKVRRKVHVRKSDTVQVISGKDRGKRGRVLRVMPKDSQALVEGVNMVKRHTKPIPQRNIKGGIVEKEGPIHISNLMVVDPDTDKPTRVGRKRLEDGKRVRIAKMSGAVLDKG
jgi:large subunit ribosomal protein L24